MLSFEEGYTPGTIWKCWMVQAKIEHNGNCHNAVLHIDPLTFETKSAYSIDRKYAELIERIIFLAIFFGSNTIQKFPIGKSWGKLHTYGSFPWSISSNESIMS